MTNVKTRYTHSSCITEVFIQFPLFAFISLKLDVKLSFNTVATRFRDYLCSAVHLLSASPLAELVFKYFLSRLMLSVVLSRSRLSASCQLYDISCILTVRYVQIVLSLSYCCFIAFCSRYSFNLSLASVYVFVSFLETTGYGIV